MREFTVKVKVSLRTTDFIKKHSVNFRLLAPLIESYWKPEGIDLKDFPPDKKVIRLRMLPEQPEKTTIDELNFYPQDESYTHDKIRLFEGTIQNGEEYLKGKDYERWAEIKLRATEHEVKLPSGSIIGALEEEIDGKKTLVKFETESETEIKEIVESLGLTSEDLILKNRAQLLAEERGLF